MTTPATMRRGACPGLTTPMPTGDGLLARLMPIGTIALAAMTGLCAAARAHGNGILEITSRGSIQVRGLTEASAPEFADAVAQLGIAAQEGVPVIADPLAGLDPDEVIDAGALAAEVRAKLATASFAERLSPKISVAIDGGGALHLGGLTADVRLEADTASDRSRLHVAVGGDGRSAIRLDTVAFADAADRTIAFLERIAAHGPQARGRDLARATDARASSPPCTNADPIGVHPLRNGTLAVGVGFAFGHTDAATLERLLRAATGARGLRTSPGRALLVIGVSEEIVATLVDAAASLGFVVSRNDPRRRVVACAGSPVCTSAEIPARALAPEVATSAAPLLGACDVIHISGCAKGCAHHRPAALTAIGRDGACDLVVDDASCGSCAVAALPHRLAALAAQRSVRDG
jgi:precorrin-3B synthase